jgi:flap endonuclease-1
MGIKSLNKFLRNNCPQIYKQVHISDFAFKKVAIDISLYLCKFKTVCGERWLAAFINLIACLRRNEIHCVFIYDTGYPQEKVAEREERALARQKTELRVCELEDAMEHFYATNEVRQILIDLYKRKNKVMKNKRLLGYSVKVDMEIDIKVVDEDIKKMRGGILDMSNLAADFALTKILFDILNVPYYDAPMEAETMCSCLCKRGLVDAVLSEDTDVLAYGAPIFLSKIDTTNDICVQIDYGEMLKALELKKDEFLDLCIMCGTDYNKNIFRVGPEKAYKYILQYRSIEDIDKNTKLDVSILNHVRGRELFKDYEQKQVDIPYCGKPDFTVLSEFIVKNNVKINIEGLRRSFIHNVIVFEEDVDTEKVE